MDKLLEKIKSAGVLTPEEFAELETKLVPSEDIDVNAPMEEVAQEPTEETPAEEPIPTPPAPLGEPEPLPEVPEVPPTPEVAMPEAANVETGEVEQEIPSVETEVPAEVGTGVSMGDLDQVKTTISTLENKIRALEDVLSKLSVNAETPEDDFGISGKGKTVAGGEAYEDKAAQLVKKMGGFSR